MSDEDPQDFQEESEYEAEAASYEVESEQETVSADEEPVVEEYEAYSLGADDAQTGEAQQPAMTPPPIPEKRKEVNPDAFAYQAAKGAVLAPVLMIFLGIASNSAMQEAGRAAKIGIGLFSLLIALTGLGLSIVALVGISRFGTKGLLVRGLLGLICGGGFSALFVAGFLSGLDGAKRNRQASAELDRAREELQQDIRNSFNEEEGVTGSGADRLEKFQQRIDSASANMTGE